MSVASSDDATRSSALNVLPLPMSNADAEPYWAGARDNRLRLQRCVKCTAFRFPPGYCCRVCTATETEWIDVSGLGAIYSFSIIYRAPAPEFKGVTPYVLALVTLEEGPRIMAHVIGDGAHNTAIGDRVEVVFEQRRDGVKVPQFRRRP